MALLGSGTFLVTYVVSDGSGPGIGARLFDGAGLPLGPQFVVNQTTTGWQTEPRVAATGDRFVVVWEHNYPNNVHVRGRVVLDDGTMAGIERVLPLNPALASWSPVVTPRPGGGIAAAWSQERFHGSEIRLALFDGTLSPLGVETTVNEPGPQSMTRGDPVLTVLPQGYVVAWAQADNASPANRWDARARWLDANGIASGPEVRLQSTDTFDQIPRSASADASGHSLIIWHSGTGAGSSAALARRFDPAGVPLGELFPVSTTYQGLQWPLDVAMLPDGSFVVVWTSEEVSNRGVVLARRYFFPRSIAVSTGPGQPNLPLVEVARPDGMGPPQRFQPYGTAGYGATVGAGAIGGSSPEEVLTGPGPSSVAGPHVRAFQPGGTPLPNVSYYAYGTLKFGVRVAGTDLDGDGTDEILTGPGAGSVFGPHVRGWSYDGAAVQTMPGVSFFAYQTLRWGVVACGGDVDGDAPAEILTGPGPGVPFGSQVRGFDVDGSVAAMGKVDFYAFPQWGYGAMAAAADIESDGRGGYGDGYEEILTGPGPDPMAYGAFGIFDFDGDRIAALYQGALSPSYFGLSVAGGDVDAGDTEEMVVAPGPDPVALVAVTVWELEPDIGTGGPSLTKLGPSEHVAFGGSTAYGAGLALGTFD